MICMSDDITALADRLRTTGDAYCSVTVVRTENATSAKAGAKALVTQDGRLHGFVGGSCVEGAVMRAAVEVLASGTPRLIRVKPKDDVETSHDRDGVELHRSSCPSGGTVDLFLDPVQGPRRLVVCGNSPIARALAEIGRALGDRVTLAGRSDDGSEFAGEQLPLDDFDLSDLPIGERDAVIVATQGRRDRDAIRGALRSQAGYIGMVGSHRKIAALREKLQGEIDARTWARLRAPAGLPIGAIGPEEIALAIMAEIVSLRRTSEAQKDSRAPR